MPTIVQVHDVLPTVHEQPPVVLQIIAAICNYTYADYHQAAMAQGLAPMTASGFNSTRLELIAVHVRSAIGADDEDQAKREDRLLTLERWLLLV